MSRIAKRAGESALGVLPDGPRIAVRRALRERKERARLRRADLTVIGHPKSGSTWLRFTLARLYQQRHGLPEAAIPRIETYHRLDPAIPRLRMAGFEYVKHVVARPAPDPELGAKRTVFVVRHPLDVVVSLYFHIRKHAAHERKLFNNWPLSLEDVSIHDFALRDDWGVGEAIAFYNDCARHAAAMPEAMILSYEEMRTDTAAAIRRLTRFAGADFGDDEIRDAVEFTSADRLRDAERSNAFGTYRLRPGNPDDPESFKVRRAKIHGYRDYFGPEELEELEGIVAAELDPSLGYSSLPSDSASTRHD